MSDSPKLTKYDIACYGAYLHEAPECNACNVKKACLKQTMASSTYSPYDKFDDDDVTTGSNPNIVISEVFKDQPETLTTGSTTVEVTHSAILDNDVSVSLANLWNGKHGDKEDKIDPKDIKGMAVDDIIDALSDEESDDPEAAEILKSIKAIRAKHRSGNGSKSPKTSFSPKRVMDLE